jgi:hypothetical protein
MLTYFYKKIDRLSANMANSGTANWKIPLRGFKSNSCMCGTDNIE